MIDATDTQRLVLDLINLTNKCVFLTGKAGTGKTTLLKKILDRTYKNTVVVAPTGVAALNAGGVTAHSLFQLPFSAFVPTNSNVSVSQHIHFETPQTLGRNIRMAANKQSVIRQMELLIIDEVSMLRADMLDAIDHILRRVRKNSLVFGGVQVLFIGDLMQLPPVVKPAEWELLKEHYESMFFFHSHAYKKCGAAHMELKKIYRQADQDFIEILNNLRFNSITESDKMKLDKYLKPNFRLRDYEGYIFLTTHNAKADKVNQSGLDLIADKEYSFDAEIVGEFPEHLYPLDKTLRIKVGAQVMFIKNDTGETRLFYNGKIGKIHSIIDGEIMVHFPKENITINVPKHEWENKRYVVEDDTKEVREEILGTFVHYPIKLAWAITIHKSQGLTFDKAVIDVQDVFQPGQAYVALSRLTSLDGLVLINPMKLNLSQNDHTVLNFSKNESSPEQLAAQLHHGKKQYINTLIAETFLPEQLLKAWRTHRFSYKNEAPNSEKSKHSEWAITQYHALESLYSIAEKFQRQIINILDQQPLNKELVIDRLDNANAYFFKPLDVIYEQLIRKIVEVKKIKRSKTHYNELLVLEEMHCAAILKMYKTKRLVELALNDAEIKKERLTSSFAENYRKNKWDAIPTADIGLSKLKNSQTTTSRSKKSQDVKIAKSTYETTLELWDQYKDVKRVAEQRKLTVATIYSHLLVLINKGNAKIEDILDERSMTELEIVFKNNFREDTTLTELKAIVGEKFGFEELRIFRTHWLEKKKTEKN